MFLDPDPLGLELWAAKKLEISVSKPLAWKPGVLWLKLKKVISTHLAPGLLGSLESLTSVIVSEMRSNRHSWSDSFIFFLYFSNRKSRKINISDRVKSFKPDQNLLWCYEKQFWILNHILIVISLNYQNDLWIIP
jgi:hypothetical protein